MGYAPYPVAEKRRHRRQWRYYETPAGNKPVKKFIDGLSDADAAEVFAGMRDVATRRLCQEDSEDATAGHSAGGKAPLRLAESRQGTETKGKAIFDEKQVA